MNGHRSKFQIDSTLKFEQSALSMHAYLKHKDDFNMQIFKLGIVKQVNPNSLNRLEDYFITKFRTNIYGLNRIVVVR